MKHDVSSFEFRAGGYQAGSPENNANLEMRIADLSEPAWQRITRPMPAVALLWRGRRPPLQY